MTEPTPPQEPQPVPESASTENTLVNHIQQFSRYAPPLRSTLADVLSAAMLPVFLWLIIWQLSPAYDVNSLQGALVRSLMFAVPLFFCAVVLSRLCRVNGTAEQHFGWSPILCDGLLKTTNKLAWICLPLTVLFTALETFAEGVYYESLGRFAFIGSMLMLGVGLWETGKSVSSWCDSQCEQTSWASGFRSLSLNLIAISPLALAFMAAAGFHFTAVQLSWRLLVTILLTLSISVITGLVSRLLLITQFRVKLRRLDRDGSQTHNEETIDINEISGQVNSLLRVTALVVLVTMAWKVWSHVLPAIGYLDEVHLWHSAIADAGEVSWITLRHILMAVAVLSITFVLSRNLPGLLEITLLDRLPLDRGGRYAISFVLRYLVGVAGTLFALQLIGFSWKSVQLVAAGLTVGLGFGLQEIFANLVSGIIILIERPIRVGDMVTVNGVTGTVTQLQLRATTIKDLDHRELIVPNKKFITEDVMNWTLTDRLSRLTFPVGIAYGSDTTLAEQTLLQVAYDSPLVLNIPKPTVLFKSFGDSTLDFELRVVIPARETFAEVQHQLNMDIEKAFREQKIEIAFPQQDVHLKGLESISWPPPKDREEKPGVRAQLGIATPAVSAGGEDVSNAAFAKRKRTSRVSKLPEVSFDRKAA